RIAFIFHCEYSQYRAPQAYNYFRSCDRVAHAEHWPHLSFPNLFILDGGYREFYQFSPQLCQPFGTFISQWDLNFSSQCKTETAKMRQQWGGKQGTKRNRDQHHSSSRTLQVPPFTYANISHTGDTTNNNNNSSNINRI